jgi:anoctamin-8
MFPLHKQNLQQLRTRWVTYWRHPRACSQALLPRVQEQPLTAITSSRRYSETAIGRSYYEDPTAISRPTSILRDNCLTRLVGNCLYQPIDDVAQYYGEKVAFYFAWLEMYTRWLIWPSIAGIILFVLQVRGKSLDQPIAPLYAIFMAFWVSAFLIAWKRRAAVLAYRWGVLGYEDEEITRPEFKGDAAYSTPSTTPGPDIGNAIKKYPAWKRYLKYFVTIPAVIGCIGIVMVITFYAFTTRDRLESKSIQAKALASNIAADLRKDMTLANFKKLSALADADFWFYFLITPILYGLLIPMMDFLFTKIARKMNNWENHRTETRYQSHLILKVFSFRFVHVFASLYYYAFASGANLLRVAIQLASFMIAGQLWKNVMETGFPFFKRRYLIRKKRKATNEQFEQSAIFKLALRGGGTVAATGVNGSGPNVSSGLGLSGLGGGTSDLSGVGMGLGGASGAGLNSVIHEQCVRLEQASDKAWEEAELQKYDTFEDYTEMLIQFGYVSFFSIAFPLAPLLAFLNNLVELRTDAFKVCHAKQRPIAHKASGIGIWFPVLQLMSVLAVLTNCLHIAFTTTQIESLFPNITTENKVWVVFFVEHLVLALKVWMTFIVPSMPSDVKEKVRLEREIAKRESARAIAAKLIHSLQPQTIIEEDEEEEESQEEEEEEEENNHILSPSGDLNLIGGQKKVEEEEEEEEDNNRASNKMQKPIEVPETTTAVSSSSSSSFSTNMRNRRPSIGGDNRQ